MAFIVVTTQQGKLLLNCDHIRTAIPSSEGGVQNVRVLISFADGSTKHIPVKFEELAKLLKAEIK